MCLLTGVGERSSVFTSTNIKFQKHHEFINMLTTMECNGWEMTIGIAWEWSNRNMEHTFRAGLAQRHTGLQVHRQESVQ